MTDPFDVATTRQRVVVMVAILAYFVLFGVELATGNPRAAALADLVIAALAIPASVIVVRRAMAGAEPDWVAVLAAVAFLVAGIAIGYGGIAALTDLPQYLALETLGSLALLIALLLYLYRTWQ